MLAEFEALLARQQRFLSNTAVPFVLYARSIRNDGSIAGITEQAEKRAYIEGNAMNSQASKDFAFNRYR